MDDANSVSAVSTHSIRTSFRNVLQSRLLFLFCKTIAILGPLCSIHSGKLLVGNMSNFLHEQYGVSKYLTCTTTQRLSDFTLVSLFLSFLSLRGFVGFHTEEVCSINFFSKYFVLFDVL